MQRGEIEYAKAGEHHIAFRELRGDGGGDEEVVMVTGETFSMESLFEDRVALRLLEGLAGLGRLIVFDRRGIGLSDPISDWQKPMREQWAEDLAAVIDAAGCDRPTVFSWQTSTVARTCTTLYPARVGRLVLFNPAARASVDDEESVADFAGVTRRMRTGELVDDVSVLLNPGRASEPAFRQWVIAALRVGAGPTQVERLIQSELSEPLFDHSRISTPTLVISRLPQHTAVPRDWYLRAAQAIPDARHVDLGEGDIYAIGLGVDGLLAEISRFLTGEVRLPTPERQVAVILFTDLVGSTRRAVSSGDTVWKRLLDDHDAINRREVSHRGGEVIKTTGDGILAILPSATAAIDAARAIRTTLREHDLRVRIGVHLGEIDRRGDDVSGLAVNIAARIMAKAEPDQIVASAVVCQTAEVVTSRSLGPATLKDVEGTWELHDVTE